MKTKEYDKGAEAALKNVAGTNPYPKGSNESKMWKLGYAEALIKRFPVSSFSNKVR